MSKNLTPAPIDNKNVMEDWINDVFDNGDCTEDRKRIIGFIDHSPAMASWHNNVLIWTFYEEGWLDRQNSIKELKKRLAEIAQANPELISQITEDEHGLVQKFYWNENNIDN